MIPLALKRLLDVDCSSINEMSHLRHQDHSWNLGESILQYKQQYEILPQVGRQLRSLKHLKITSCNKTEGLLHSPGELTNLEDLNWTFGETFEGLPKPL